jgi:hypothetical protein
MGEGAHLRRMNVYVDPDDLARVARDLGCRPSEAVRRLIDNYLLATEIDEVRRMPGPGPDPVFRREEAYKLAALPEDETVDGVEEGIEPER